MSPVKSRTRAADIPHMDRLRHEHGFTLVEILIATLMVGLLAAIALPSFIGQRAKAQDASAKSDAQNMVTQLESCRTERDRYDGCPEGNTGLTIGSGPGEVDLQIPAGGDKYKVVAYSFTGNTFSVAKDPDGTTTRSCEPLGTSAGGCRGGSW